MKPAAYNPERGYMLLIKHKLFFVRNHVTIMYHKIFFQKGITQFVFTYHVVYGGSITANSELF